MNWLRHTAPPLVIGLGLLLCAPSASSTEPTPLSKEMQNHWTVATDARNRVLYGDLAGARLLGRDLANRPAPDALPEPWRPLYAEMQQAADSVARADTLQDAGVAVGGLALTCAECHEFTGGGPKYLALPMPPPALAEGESDMPLHLWALDWLWVGLISQSPEAWDRGAATLEQAPFHPLPDQPHSGLGLSAMEHLVHLLPGLAAGDDRAEQARRFGETLTACSLCHAEVKAVHSPQAPTTPSNPPPQEAR